MASSYDHIKGKIILHAVVTVKEGQADRALTLLKAIQKHSLSDQEPGCLTYRICRNGNEFFVFEEYQNGAAVQAHFETEGFQALVEANKQGDLATEAPKILYYEEA